MYQLWAVTQNALHTDDSFAFNRVLQELKNDVQALPDATEEDDAALSALTVSEGRYLQTSAQPQEGKGRSENREAGAQHRGTAGDLQPEDDDPFALNSLFLDRPHKHIEPKTEPQKTVATTKVAPWNSREALCMRRQALLDCIQTAQARHKLAWARVGVELLLEHAYACKHKFCSAHAATLHDMHSFVARERLRRKRGGGGDNARANPDNTSFDKARAAWSKVHVSARGKVGADGDTKSNAWLG